MPRIDFTEVGWCRDCKLGQHDQCDIHMNDNAVDALDFINVSCDCPCEGDVRSPEHHGLIELIVELREELSRAHDEICDYHISLEVDSPEARGYTSSEYWEDQ